MQYLRYNPAPTPATAPSCLPPSSTIPSSDPRVTAQLRSRSLHLAVSPDFSRTRVVNFYACASGIPSQSSLRDFRPLLHAEVAYNDLNAQGVDDCYAAEPVAVTTSCGPGMNVDIWDVIGADT